MLLAVERQVYELEQAWLAGYRAAQRDARIILGTEPRPMVMNVLSGGELRRRTWWRSLWRMARGV